MRFMPATLDLSHLTADVFCPLVGDVFKLSEVGSSVALTLAAVEARPLQTGPGGREPFSLLLHGPVAPVLPQRIYALDHDGLGQLHIFLVPVGPALGVSVMRYEAIFS